jgi:hypothetical protein
LSTCGRSLRRQGRRRRDFFLELNLTSETLEFTAVNGPIPNRGFLQADIELAGITYLQQINDSFDNSGQHIEPGIWVNVPVITGPAEPGTVARMASIPHGTTINAQGRAITAPQPIIKPASITPFTIGNPAGLVHFPEEDLSIASTSRTDLSRVPGLTQAQLTDPNQFLTQAIVAQTITSTTVLIISTDSTPAGSVPDAGEGRTTSRSSRARRRGDRTLWRRRWMRSSGSRRCRVTGGHRIRCSCSTASACS